MYEIDVTITACRRYNVLMETLHSFYYGLLKGQDCRCIINVDPLGPNQAENLFDLCKRYFPRIVWRKAEKPNFASAFKWCWEQVKRPWVLHLEDDWKLERWIDFGEMFKVMKEEPDLALLRLPQFKSSKKEMKNWNKFFPWNGRYYECPKDLRGAVGFCGHPSLIRSEFVKSITPLLSTESNPEKQFHTKTGPIMDEVMKWRYGVYSDREVAPIITDIGRRWMIHSGYKKKGNKAFFMEWEEVK